jgi:hypothetical protein
VVTVGTVRKITVGSPSEIPRLSAPPEYCRDVNTLPTGSDETLTLHPIANRCNSAACPTIYVTGTGTVVVQGYTVPAERAGLAVDDGETLVEIPLELLAEAVRNLA